MTDLTVQNPAPQADAEYRAVLAVYMAETQNLLEQMKTEQTEMDHLKRSSCLRDAEMESLKVQTQEMLNQIEAMI